MLTAIQVEGKNKSSNFEPSLTVIFPAYGGTLMDDTVYQYLKTAYLAKYSTCQYESQYDVVFCQCTGIDSFGKLYLTFNDQA